jgi:hypothetical protein
MNLLNKFKAKGLQDLTPKRGNRTFDQMAESDDFHLLTGQEIQHIQRQLAKARKAKKHTSFVSQKEDEQSKKTPKYKEGWKSSLHGDI